MVTVAAVVAATLFELAPVTESVLMVRLGGDCPAGTTPWSITSADDPAYRIPQAPVQAGRKSYGRDFDIQTTPVWKPVWTMEHRVFLALPRPMVPGRSYRLVCAGLPRGRDGLVLAWDSDRSRSEAIHVNQVGFTPGAPRKSAFLSGWLGTLGALNLDRWQGKTFRVRLRGSGTVALTGRIVLRKRAAAGPDGGQPQEGSHWRTDVWECDFSRLTQPGEYVLSVDGLGCSDPFRIVPDAYRPAFEAVMRGLYQQRCGTALMEPWTHWTRSVCHHPAIRPILQSTIRRMDRQCDACQDVEATRERRDIWGGYHDAGDWDREPGHPEIPGVLAMAYELFPGNFRDGEANIPESGNGLPDILDEALWGLDYYRRLQRPDGGVGVGLFTDAFPAPGENAATHAGHWYCYAEEPQAAYRYAASAGHVVLALARANRAETGTLYLESARRAWQWAETHQRPGDAAIVRDDRLHAAACLFRATGERAFHEAFVHDLKITTSTTGLWEWNSHDQTWGAWTYALSDRPETDLGLRARLRAAAVHYAREFYVDTSARRANRVGFNWYRPLRWGAGAVPDTLPAVVAWVLTKDPAFREVMHAACDFTLGANPLNTCWITGTGARPPEGVFHPDSWNGARGGTVCPGIVPEGPYAYEGEPGEHGGPWDPKFVEGTFVPPAKDWPPLELYTPGRTCYPMNEFTVRQMAEAAACYGALCAAVTP